ncbi:MAG: DEAD/DEAH box helicase family protein, partial [Fusobacteria bacterium]|nr:DEAD/DEAH box helicase family protein [Fusobacteriota bacterium]
MKLKFDGNQDYQIEAIKSIVDIFEGQTSGKLDFEISTRANTIYKNELGIGNNLELEDKEILKNVQKIQLHNGIAKSLKLEGMNFTVEMETGTGKTYVYLRTILELNKNYGFTKFIIVVPSIAIKEGVYKNLQITEEHLKTIYDNISYNYFIYDSKKINSLSSYAKSNQIEIMIINIDSFNKDLNVINNEIDRMQGRKPLEFIQSTNPIVIIDEPQNMESDKSKKAIKSLNPMCTLRYSATHKNLYNLMYRLTPVDSYKKKLVKKIEVMSVTAEENLNTPFIELVKVDNKNGIKASIKIDKKEKSGIKRKTIPVKNKTDLFDISGEREVYKGWIIENISIEMGKGII